MWYAKIKNEQVVKYPYEMGDLWTENENTAFDCRFDLVGWFYQTEEHTLNGCDLVEVIRQPLPEINNETHKLVEDSVPVLIDGVWTIVIRIEEKTEEERLANRSNP